jgi:hypothetical protein
LIKLLLVSVPLEDGVTVANNQKRALELCLYCWTPRWIVRYVLATHFAALNLLSLLNSGRFSIVLKALNSCHDFLYVSDR